MEIKLNIGDKINIPENCELFVENNTLTIKEKLFEDGDILISRDIDLIVIFKSYQVPDSVIFCTHYNNDNRPNLNWISHYFSHATEEEKQKFFKDLAGKGLRWNPETKELERIRLRVEKEEEYLFVSDSGVVYSDFDQRRLCDNMRWNTGNYYLLKHRAQAEEDAKVVRAIYEKRLKVKP